MVAVAAMEPDAELMLRVKGGDTSSFALLLERHRAPVVRFLHRMVDNPAVAEELAQEVFLRVYRARESYEPTAKFTTWLFRIASRLALNWLRDGRHEKDVDSLDAETEDAPGRDVPDGAPTAEQELLRRARMEEVRKAVQALPAKQRAAVLMHKFEGMQYSQIAGALGLSEPALKSMLFRAYETLRVRLAHMA